MYAQIRGTQNNSPVTSGSPVLNVSDRYYKNGWKKETALEGLLRIQGLRGPHRPPQCPGVVSNLTCPSDNPSSSHLELRDVSALSNCPRANSHSTPCLPSAPLCLTGTINVLTHSLPSPRFLLFIGCCRSRTTNQFQSLWQ